MWPRGTTSGRSSAGLSCPIRRSPRPARLRTAAELPVEAEPDADVRVVLLDLVAVDHSGRLEDLHAFDAAQRLRRLGECRLRRVAPGLGRHTDEVDALDDRHAVLPVRLRSPL